MFWLSPENNMYILKNINSSKKYNKLVNVTKKKQTHRHREQTVITSGGRGGGGADRERGVRGTNY